MNSPRSTTASPSVDAVVSLGSNRALGSRAPADLVRDAISSLRLVSQDASASSLYSSAPQDCPPGSDDFINAVMVVQLPAATTAQDLLAITQRIEAQYGRQRGTGRNLPRTLDIDIISFADQELETEQLTLPHPRAAQREFVLLPLAEIDPDRVLPGLRENIAQLLAQLPQRGSVKRLES